MKRFRLMLALFTLPVLGGCPEKTALWIQPGSTSEHLVFRVSSERGAETPLALALMRIDRYDRVRGEYDLFWGFDATMQRIEVSEVEFGVLPDNTEPLEGAADEAMLLDGCYLAFINGIGQVVFFVTQGGEVLELAWRSCSAVYAEQRS